MSENAAKLAVLIDADNAQPAVIEELLAEVAKYGTAHVRRAYGDWTGTSLKGWKEQLLTQSIQPIQQFAYTRGKNATDAALVIDAMDLLYSGTVDGFAIVSSDSDFTPLATRLRESGKRVIGVGQRKTPQAFVTACERFLFLEVLTQDGTPPEEVTDNPPRPIQSLITKALNKIDTDDENWTSVSALGSHLNRTDPSFDPRNYGYNKLSDLVKGQPFVETKAVSGSSGRGTLWVRLKGRRPSGAQATAKKTPAKKAATKRTTAES